MMKADTPSENSNSKENIYTTFLLQILGQQTSLDSWFFSHRMPCTLQPGIPNGKCAALLSHTMRAAFGYFHKAVCSLRTETSLQLLCPAQARPNVTEAGSG